MIWQKKVELATRYGIPSFATVHVAEDHTIYVVASVDGDQDCYLKGTKNQWGDLVHAIEEALRKSEGE